MNDQFVMETLYRNWGQRFTIDEVLFENRTAHQHLIIFRNRKWGVVMALDGVIQTTEKDEFIYHEMMTHVPIMACGEVKKVLIIGGGDGGILREVLKYPGVKSVTQVEIDQQVIDMCIQYLPNHSAGAYDDPRVKIVIADGVDFIDECDEKYDVIISDSTDPIGPGESLFTSKFYQGVSNCLSDHGVFVAQNGVSFLQLDELITTNSRLKPYFKDVGFYSAAVPTYVGGIMVFAWASHNPALRNLSREIIDKRAQQISTSHRYYNSNIHHGSFALPQYVLDAIANS